MADIETFEPQSPAAPPPDQPAVRPPDEIKAPETAGVLTDEPTEAEQQEQARQARETAGRVPRRRAAVPAIEPAPPPLSPEASEQELRRRYLTGPQDNGPELLERARLNVQNSRYRGTGFGALRLAALAHLYGTPDGPDDTPEMKKAKADARDEYVSAVADLAAYDAMPDWENWKQFGTAVGGTIGGALTSPESFIGWTAQGATWLTRTARAALQQGTIQAAIDPLIQALNIQGGVQKDYDYLRTIESFAIGATIGAVGHGAGEVVDHMVSQQVLRKTLFDLGAEDPAFDSARHAIWALDPNNGIVAPKIVPPERPGVAAAAPELPAPPLEPPRYPAGPEHGFQDTLIQERERLAASYGAAQPGAKRLNEEARFAAFDKEAGEHLQAAIEQYALDPETVRLGDIWRHYDRTAGEAPQQALERAIGKWVTAEERRALQEVRDPQLEADLAEWARAYDAERADFWYRSMALEATQFGRFEQVLPGISPIWREYRPGHIPEEIIGERPIDRFGPPEGRDIPAGRPAEPAAGEGAAGRGGGAAVRGEPGAGRAAAEEGAGRAAAAEPARAEGVEAPSPAPRPANVPEETPDQIFRGYGREKQEAAYFGTSRVPVAGPGRYFSFDEAHAATFGPNLERQTLGAVVRNPLIVRGDEDWRALTKKAGWEFPNPFGKSDAEMTRLVAELQRVAKAEGHDGLVVWFDPKTPYDIDPATNKSIKTLRNVFGEPQVVAFERPPAVEPGAEGRPQTLLPGIEPITARQRLEAEARRPLRGGEAPPPTGGLFDEGARAQRDLFAIAQRRGAVGRLPEEQRRPAAGMPQALSPEQDVAVNSLQRQAMNLARALDVPLRQGRITRRSAEGVFKASGVIRVREVPDFEVVAHESGHWIEAKLGADLTHLTNLHGIELAPLVSDPNAYAPSQYVKEGFAEFVRRYIGNPARAKVVAPNFYNDFQAFMAERAPDMLRALNEAQVSYRAYLDASSVDAVGSVRRSQADDPQHGFAKARKAVRDQGLPGVIKSVMLNAYTGFLDNNAPVARVVRELGVAIRDYTGRTVKLESADNPEVLLRLWNRSRQAATRDMIDGVRPYHEITPRGPSLRDALVEATGQRSDWGKWDDVRVRDFSSYLIARRAEVLWRRFDDGLLDNPPTAFSAADARQALADLEAANPTFRNASDMVHAYSRQLLRKAYEAGLLPTERFEKLVAEEFYVPFMRDMSERPGAGAGLGAGAEGPGTTAIVRRLRGSARDIKDPIESLMMQTFLVNRTAQHNDIMLALRNLARRAGPEGGRYVEEIPAHEARRYIADLEQAITNRAKEIGLDPEEAKTMIAALGDPGGADPVMGSYFKMEQAAARGEPIVFYREGGELKALRLMGDKEGHALYETLTAAPDPVTDLWVQLIGAAAAVKRAGIVTNPTFALSNYIRDQVAASILRSDYVPIVSGLRGIHDEFRQGQNAVLYGYAGGVAGGAAIGPVERAVETEINALKGKGYLVQRVTSFKGLLELASFTEAGTRNSIFSTVFEASKRRGLSDYEAMIEAAFQAQDLIDFSRHGSHTRMISRMLPFLNASLQGLDKARRVFFDPLINRLRQGQVFEQDSAEFNNAIAAWVKFGALGGALGAVWAAINWDKDSYRDASPYFKGTHLVVPFGNKLFVMPKPFELGLGFTAGEYAYHALVQKDPRAAAQFAEAAWHGAAPPNPLLDLPVITPALELTVGKSGFTGREIVPERLQRLPSEMQFDDRTSELAKWLGQATGLSPIKIEYAIGSAFGTWGRDIMALSQGVSEDAPAAALDDAFLARRFIKDPTRSSETTRQFWDYMSSKTGRFNRSVAGYNDLVRDAQIRGQPLDQAADYLSKMPAPERAYVTLKSGAKENGKAAFNADEKRLHPLQRAYDAVQMLNGLRRELASNQTSAYADRLPMRLDPEQRRLLLDNVRVLGQMEMRNAFVIMGEKGYEGRPMYDPQDVMDTIRSIAPTVADEIATRYATSKIYTTDAVRQAWPKLRDELIRYGTDAEIRGLASDARIEGYEFGGTRVRKPGVRRAPIAGTQAP